MTLSRIQTIVLTVVAVDLSVLALHAVTSPAQAQPGPNIASALQCGLRAASGGTYCVLNVRTDGHSHWDG